MTTNESFDKISEFLNTSFVETSANESDINKEIALLEDKKNEISTLVNKKDELTLKDKEYIEAGNKALNILKLSNNNQVKLLWWPRFIRITEWLKEYQDFSKKAFLENPGKIKILDNFSIKIPNSPIFFFWRDLLFL